MIDLSTYLNRITSQHKVQPKFMGLVQARLEPLADIFELLEEIDKSFDLDTATGRQLDTIGEYIGVKRLLDFQPEYADAVLTDPYYRMLLKARVSLNNWDGSISGIKEIWGGIFPEYEIQVIDNQDMTMEARIIGLRALFESELVQHGYISPKPMGVDVGYTVVMSIKVNAGLFLGAFNTSRVGAFSPPPPEPPRDSTKKPETIYTAGGKPTKNVRFETVSKSPPKTVLISAAEEREGSLFASIQKNSEIENKSIPEELEPPLLNEYSSAAVIAAFVRRTTIESKVRS